MRLFLFTPPTTLPNEHAALHSLAARAKSTATTSDGGGFLPAALHVRKPGADEASVEAYLKKLPRSLLERAVLHSHHALAGKFDVQGVHFTEAARNALPGGRPQRPPGRDSSGRAAAAPLTLSTSLHSCAEVEAEAAAARRRRRDSSSSSGTTSTSSSASAPCYDYVFLSPIFESISKPGYGGTGSCSAQLWEGEGEGEGEEQGSSGGRKPSRALTAALASAAAREFSTPPLGVVALGGVDASNLGLVRGLGFEAAAVLGAVWGEGGGSGSSAADPVEAWAEVVEAAAALS